MEVIIWIKTTNNERYPKNVFSLFIIKLNPEKTIVSTINSNKYLTGIKYGVYVYIAIYFNIERDEQRQNPHPQKVIGRLYLPVISFFIKIIVNHLFSLVFFSNLVRFFSLTMRKNY